MIKLTCKCGKELKNDEMIELDDQYPEIYDRNAMVFRCHVCNTGYHLLWLKDIDTI